MSAEVRLRQTRRVVTAELVIAAEPRSGEGRAVSSAAAESGIAAEPRSGEGRAVSSAAAESGIVDPLADLPEGDMPADVVDRLLWRNSQRILGRHVERLDGSCHWCGQPAPCDARKLALRAAEVARMPWREAWRARNEITGLLPVVTAELHHRANRPVARARTRRWTRVRVRGSAS